jgi:hypothetical protein
VDVVRAYTRWFRRRRLVLLSAAGAAALLGVHLARIEDLRESARLALLVTVGGIELFLLGVSGLAWLCHRLHLTRPRGEGRVVRRLLEPAERLVAPAVLLLLPLALAPATFRRPEPPPPEILVAPRRPIQRVPPPPLLAAEPGPLRPAAVESARQIAPLPDSKREIARPVSPESPPPPAPAQDVVQGGDNDAFRLLYEDVAMPEPRIVFDRLGVPDEERPLEGRLLSVELDALVLWEDDAPTGSGFEIRIDLPIEHGPILRLSTLYIGDAGEPDLADGSPEFALTHGSLDLVFRLSGGTRQAAVDLWLSVGLAVDELESEGLDGGPRLSPRVGVELALWQTERAGFELRVGQTIPLSATGAALALTDASAAVRVDLSERISLRAGWRYIVVHARDYEGAFASGGVLAELDRDFSGPFIGVEIRF